ncbi:hypothetical protein GF354_06120 [Candidatus Peregrinibacteria bacterium]|nr:hypothetical protein [Candidatus Peregrinibacteria bacterium]
MNKKRIAQLVLFLILLFAIVSVAHAYRIDPNFKPINQPFGLENETLGTTEGSGEAAVETTRLVLNIIAGTLLYFAAPIAVIMVALAGGSMVISGSNPDKVDQAKKHLTWTVAGLLLIILSWSIIRIIIEAIIYIAG